MGVEEEGLFRIAAGASKVRCMKLRLDSNCLDLESAVEYRDPHIIAGVLKSYLRQLPEPLLTHHLYEEWMAAAKYVYNLRLLTTQYYNNVIDINNFIMYSNYLLDYKLVKVDFKQS